MSTQTPLARAVISGIIPALQEKGDTPPQTADMYSVYSTKGWILIHPTISKFLPAAIKELATTTEDEVQLSMHHLLLSTACMLHVCTPARRRVLLLRGSNPLP